MNFVLRNIGQLATCPPDNPQSDAGLITKAAVVVEGSRVAWSGPDSQLSPAHQSLTVYDCGGRLMIPGLVDCHTHLCFAGWRAEEFTARNTGKSYMDLQAEGGGIGSTVDATRSASKSVLFDRALEVLDEMLQLGVTTVECKSGYGLDRETEIKQLEVYAQLDESHPVRLLPTYLGAHVVPREFEDKREAYVRLICETVLPEIAERQLAAFCDVFLESNAFHCDEARSILTHAKALGLGLKIHADQLSNGNGAALAAELGAYSADHLEYADAEGIAALASASVVAVSLPFASMYLHECFLPARKFMDAGVRVAVATDFNPGSAPSFHLPLAMTLAAIHQSMSPTEVLMGATTVASQALGLQDKVGSLIEGYAADLALIDAVDLDHWIYHLRPNACCAVMRGGQWVVGEEQVRRVVC